MMVSFTYYKCDLNINKLPPNSSRKTSIAW